MRRTLSIPPLVVVVMLLGGCRSTPPAPAPLAEADVVRLARAQPSADVLRLAVYNSGLDFALDPAALRRLKQSGLSEEQLVAVLEGAVALESDTGVPVRDHGDGSGRDRRSLPR